MLRAVRKWLDTRWCWTVGWLCRTRLLSLQLCCGNATALLGLFLAGPRGPRLRQLQFRRFDGGRRDLHRNLKCQSASRRRVLVFRPLSSGRRGVLLIHHRNVQHFHHDESLLINVHVFLSAFGLERRIIIAFLCNETQQLFFRRNRPVSIPLNVVSTTLLHDHGHFGDGAIVLGSEQRFYSGG